MDHLSLKNFEALFLELKRNILNETKLNLDTITLEKGDDLETNEAERIRALELRLVGRQSFMLKKIDNALFKIKNGSYGICEDCDGEIELNRLKARPTATQCIHCKEIEEKGEGQVLYEKRSHTFGKALLNNVVSLKDYQKEDNIITLNSENF